MGSAPSSIGAAIGTSLLPEGLATIGVGPSMLLGAGILAIGAIVSHIWASETTGLVLTKAGGKRPLGKILAPGVSAGD
jgi:putative MFS transporter